MNMIMSVAVDRGKNILARLQKNIRFDFDGELKIRYVRYKHLTKITIKVQLF